MERRGSGLKKILREYEKEALHQFFSDQQYFIVTLINKNYGERKTVQKTTQKTTQKNEKRILALILDNPNITQNDISEKLGDITP